MKQMVEQINAQRPDVVVIAGDIFDNEYEALDYPENYRKFYRPLTVHMVSMPVMAISDIDEKILAGFTF